MAMARHALIDFDRPGGLCSKKHPSYVSINMADEDIGMDSPRKKVAYDPDQDPEEKRVLRQKYRVLLKDEEGQISIHRIEENDKCVTFLSFLLLVRPPTQRQ